MNNREPNEDLLDLSNKLEIQAIEHLKLNQLNESYRLYEKILGKIREVQEKEKRPIHKGLPLHMMGFILRVQGKDDESLYLFMLAYIEDFLNEPTEKEYLADYKPAFFNIAFGSAFDIKIIKKIKEYLRKKKKEKIDVFEPEEILKELGYNKEDLPKYRNLDIRVFVGGDYLINSENITLVERHVRDLGHLPVIPYYLSRDPNTLKKIIPDNVDYDFSLRLLKGCSKAIFSIAHGGGHFCEITKCKDWNKKPLLILHEFIGEKDKDKKLSGMITSIGFPIKFYNDPFEELKQLIKDYLT